MKNDSAGSKHGSSDVPARRDGEASNESTPPNGPTDDEMGEVNARLVLSTFRAQDTLARLQEESYQRMLRMASLLHDQKGYLAGIQGFASLLKAELTQPGPRPDLERMLKWLDHIVEGSRGLKDLINDVAEVTDFQQGPALMLQRTPTDIVALARQVAADWRHVDKYQIVVSTSQDELVGHWDRPRLERVIRNLVDNAAKYSRQGGTVQMIVTRDDATPEAQAVICVRDDGIGIPVADQPHIFAPFYRASNVGPTPGTGMGLAGARQIVERHGGTIMVESAEGVGSTFTVRLPLVSGQL